MSELAAEIVRSVLQIDKSLAALRVCPDAKEAVVRTLEPVL